jgi:hypothetical protein
VPREADLKAVHEVDLAVAREALRFAGVSAVPPLAAADRPGHDVAVVAELARKRNT